MREKLLQLLREKSLKIGRFKLVSGMIIFLFGINLILNPNLLENVSVMFSIILFSIVASVAIILLKVGLNKNK